MPIFNPPSHRGSMSVVFNRYLIRELPAPGEHGSGRGRVRPDLIPVTVSNRPGPVGGQMEVNVPLGKAASSVDSTQLMHDLRGKTLVLEEQYRVSNRVKRTRVVFRGTVVTRPRNLEGSSQNELQLIVKDPWFLLANAPVSLDTKGLSVGQVFAILNFERKNDSVWNPETQEFENRITTFDTLHLWPRDASGQRIGWLDPKFFSLRADASGIELEGQPLAQAIVDLLSVREDLIPGIEYTDDGFIVTYWERGEVTFDLVEGSVDVYDPAHTQPHDVEGFRENEDYDIANEIIGKGDHKRLLQEHTLKKSWTEAEESAVLNNPLLERSARYAHVGRQWRLPRAIWPANAQAQRSSPASSQPDERSDKLRVFIRRPGGTWIPCEVDHQINFTRASGSIRNNPRFTSGGHREVNPRAGQMAYIEFAGALIYREPTGEGEERLMERGVYEVKVQAVGVGDRLTVRTGVRGDALPFARTRIRERQDAYEESVESSLWDVDAEGNVVPAESTPTRNDSAILLAECEALVAKTSEPHNDGVVELAYVDFTLRPGMRRARRFDTQGQLLAELGANDVESVEHRLPQGGEVATAAGTTLQMSKAAAEFDSGLVSV